MAPFQEEVILKAQIKRLGKDIEILQQSKDTLMAARLKQQACAMSVLYLDMLIQATMTERNH